MQSSFLLLITFVFALPLSAQEKSRTTDTIQLPLSSNAETDDRDETISAWLNGNSSGYKIEVDDDELTRLKKQRVNIVLAELEMRVSRTYSGAEPFLFLVDTHRRLRVAQMDLLKDSDEIRIALGKSVDLAKELERRAHGNWEAGKIPSQDLAHVIYFRLDCELEFARGKIEYGWSEEQLDDQ